MFEGNHHSTNFFQSLKKLDSKYIATRDENEHYSENLTKHLFEFWLPYYPLFSALILKRIGYTRGSNASIENKWRHVKRNVLRSKLRLPASVYIREIEPYILTDLANRGGSFKTSRCNKQFDTMLCDDADKYEIETFKPEKKYSRKLHHFPP